MICRYQELPCRLLPFFRLSANNQLFGAHIGAFDCAEQQGILHLEKQ
jgi:hypothetical protein